MDKTLQSSVNTAVRPQDDFFLFANGKWLEDNPIPPRESRWGSFHVLYHENINRLQTIITELQGRTDIAIGSNEQKVRDFFASGMDTEQVARTGLEVLKKYLSQLENAQNVQEIFNLVFEFHAMNTPVGFRWYVDFDDQDSSAYAFRLSQAGLGLPDRDYYITEGEVMQIIREKYQAHLETMSNWLQEKTGTAFAASDVYGLEQRLAAASMTSTERRDVEKLYNAYSPEELESAFPHITWQDYFKALGKKPERLLVDQPLFFAEWDKIISENNLPLLKNYFAWHIFRRLGSILGEEVEQAQFVFYGTVLSGALEMQPRWKRIISMTDDVLGEALGRLFVEKHFPEAAKLRVQQMVEDLRASFKERITQLDWMNEESKAIALKKLSNFTVKIGYPDTWRDYSALTIVSDAYAANMIEAGKFETARNMAKVGSVVDRGEWFMTPPEVNAYHYANLVEVVFPAGILQFPFFDFEADDAVNYGCIGGVIGHELTHGFDDKGSQFDPEGNFKNWRTDAENKAFSERAQKLVNQANAFVIQPDLHMNGELTLGENIADLGGVQIAFGALQKAWQRNGKPESAEGYTPEQRFFISYARTWRAHTRPERERELAIRDPHGADKFRCNEILKSVPVFYEAFEVKKGDGQYLDPELRTEIW